MNKSEISAEKLCNYNITYLNMRVRIPASGGKTKEVDTDR